MLRARKLLTFFRQLGRPMLTLVGFGYDAYRAVRFGGWRDTSLAARPYKLAKGSHSLEKSMAYKDRNPASGWGAARNVARMLRGNMTRNGLSFAEINAEDTLQRFLSLDDNRHAAEASEIAGRLALRDAPEEFQGGVFDVPREFLLRGRLEDPEGFFLSRSTLRHFNGEQVPEDVVRRAVALAMKTPAACNRQPWHVYHLRERKRIDAALKYQTGNKGFGHQIPGLLVICADLSAFISGNERYQHWIDGGMFAMSVVLALHSLGVGSCCLNWSKMIGDDRRLRKELGIPGRHSVIMMLGLGYAPADNRLCRSTRRPLNEVYTAL